MTERTFTAAEMRARAELFDKGDWMADIRPSANTAAMLRQAAELVELDSQRSKVARMLQARIDDQSAALTVADARWTELKAWLRQRQDDRPFSGKNTMAKSVLAEMARIEGARA